jgi:hypothetical protein
MAILLVPGETGTQPRRGQPPLGGWDRACSPIMSDLPPCGLYRTTRPLGDHVPAPRLVYFHNHGDPGPGVYLPSGWRANRASWYPSGHVIPSAEWATSLVPLPPEGFYRVREPFTCCERRCRTFAADLLVELGYDGEAHPLVFVPEWTGTGLAIPELGVRIDADRIGRLARLEVPESEVPPETKH